jgi:hypothetical protein
MNVYPKFMYRRQYFSDSYATDLLTLYESSFFLLSSNILSISFITLNFLRMYKSTHTHTQTHAHTHTHTHIYIMCHMKMASIYDISTYTD